MQKILIFLLLLVSLNANNCLKINLNPTKQEIKKNLEFAKTLKSTLSVTYETINTILNIALDKKIDNNNSDIYLNKKVVQNTIGSLAYYGLIYYDRELDDSEKGVDFERNLDDKVRYYIFIDYLKKHKELLCGKYITGNIIKKIDNINIKQYLQQHYNINTILSIIDNKKFPLFLEGAVIVKDKDDNVIDSESHKFELPKIFNYLDIVNKYIKNKDIAQAVLYHFVPKSRKFLNPKYIIKQNLKIIKHRLKINDIPSKIQKEEAEELVKKWKKIIDNENLNKDFEIIYLKDKVFQLRYINDSLNLNLSMNIDLSKTKKAKDERLIPTKNENYKVFMEIREVFIKNNTLEK